MGTGIAALAPLGFLCIHSLPILRRAAYELFVKLHVPVSIVFMVMLFWHTKNALASWGYLYATVAIWATSWLVRPLFFNWTKPGRMSWLVGDDATVTLLPENAVKVTISTQVKWKPGQYVYLRIPGVAALESHPFTVASLCSDDLPSEYGEGFRDMILVFRPFGGFTKRLAERAVQKGPYHVYRAFVDGPYGGMKRRLESFDKVILIAGGSGITALVSQLLDLIKRMRDGKAITSSIHVIWALKRPETMEWFKEELRICRECAPPEAVKCQFFITAAKRLKPRAFRLTAQTALTQDHHRLSAYLHDHINYAFQGIADRRASYHSRRTSALVGDDAAADLARQLDDEAELDSRLAVPQRAFLAGDIVAPAPVRNFSHPMMPAGARSSHDQPDTDSDGAKSGIDGDEEKVAAADVDVDADIDAEAAAEARHSFGFPQTPTEFQKNLMRFAFLPATQRTADGWSTEYGRPDLPFMLREMARDFGRRNAVFVCGPPSMRIAVSRAVAALQAEVVKGHVEEVFLHSENYAL
jgi:predicted ferric reductase